MSEHEHKWSEIESPHSVKEITVIEVRHKRGHGCCEVSLVREVSAYYLPDGSFLAEHDVVKDGAKQ